MKGCQIPFTNLPHKCFRTNGWEICNLDFHKKPLKFNNSYEDGIHINKVALSDLLKMRGTHSLELLKISKSVWHYLLSHGIIITVEYLPSKLNAQAYQESRNVRDPSDWKLHQSMFQSIIKHPGYLTVDLFASRLSHQLPQYVAWKPGPKSIATDAMQQCWNKMFPYDFPLSV